MSASSARSKPVRFAKNMREAMQVSQQINVVDRVRGALEQLVGEDAISSMLRRPEGGLKILESSDLLDGGGALRGSMWPQLFRRHFPDRGAYARSLLDQVEKRELDFDLANARLSAFDVAMKDRERLAEGAAQGFCIPHDGTTVLVADRIAPGQEAAVFLHELVHARGKAVLGDVPFARLVGQVKAWAMAGAPVLESTIYAKASLRALDSVERMDDPHFDEELLAYAVEEAVAAGVRPTLEAREGSAEQWLGDVVATLQGVMFELTHGTVPQLSAQQLVDLVYALAQLESPERSRLVLDALQAPLNRRAVEAAQSEGFATWFGNSKVVDHDGRPLMVFHGTADEVTAFDPDKVGWRHVDVEAGAAFFFSSDVETASWYAESAGKQKGSGANVMPVFLSLQNPKVVDFQGTGLEFLGSAIEDAKEQGHDGLIALDYDDGVRANHYIAFRPEQIKSAIGNSGAFSSASKDVRFSFAGPSALTADHEALCRAKEHIDAGRDEELVRRETGWHQGLDGKWRFELDDSKGFTKGEGTFEEVIMRWYRAGVERTGDVRYKTTVGDLIWHSELFKAYPEIRDVEVRMVPAGRSLSGAVAKVVGENPILMVREDLPAKQWYSVISHEIQHLIQDIEGFAAGGSAEALGEVTAEEVLRCGFAELDLSEGRTKHRLYQHLAGEVEARNVQSRIRLDRAQRSASAPASTEDIAADKQLVRMAGPAGGLRFSFAGPSARTADSEALARAQTMVERGATLEDVYLATGWHYGADGLPRFEISDHEAKLLRQSSDPNVYADIFAEAGARADGVPLAKILDHPELYAAYPSLQAMRVVVDDELTSDAMFCSERNQIRIKDPYSYKGRHDEFLEGLVHEIQHALQRIEGFARGGSPQSMRKYAIEASRPELERRYGDYPSYRKAVENDAIEVWVMDAVQATGVGISPYEAYRRLAGEVEARNAQARIRMNAKERLASWPPSTEDVSRDRQIVQGAASSGDVPGDLVLGDVLDHAHLFEVYPLAAYLPLDNAAFVVCGELGQAEECAVAAGLVGQAWSAIKQMQEPGRGTQGRNQESRTEQKALRARGV